VVRNPLGHRLGGVVRPGDKALAHALLGGGRACPGEEADELHPLLGAAVAHDLAGALGRPAGEVVVGVRLDVQLEREVARDDLQHLLQPHRVLVAGFPGVVGEMRGDDFLRASLVRPTADVRRVGQDRVVQGEDVVVARQHDVGLDPVHASDQRAIECAPRRLRTVVAPEAMRVNWQVRRARHVGS